MDIKDLLCGPQPLSPSKATRSPSRSVSIPSIRSCSPTRPSRSSEWTNTTSHSSRPTDPRQLYRYFLLKPTSPLTTSQAVSKQDDEVHRTATARDERRLTAEECPTRSPRKRKRRWTEPEKKKLRQFINSGMTWEQISKQLPGRTESSCKMYKSLGIKLNNNASDDERRTKVARLYERRKSEFWQLIAADMDISAEECEEIHWDMDQAEMILRASVPEDKSK